MAKKTETVRARLEPNLKKEAERILDKLGLNTTEAIRLFFTQIRLQGGLPFQVKVPNKATREALNEANERKNLTEFKTAEELFEEMDI